MQLKRLEINGYRGFSDNQLINFPKNNAPVVIVGVNGAGKTTILDCIVNCLRWFQSDLAEETFNADWFKRSNINIHTDFTENILRWKWYEHLEEQKTGFIINHNAIIVGQEEQEKLANNIRNEEQFTRKPSLSLIVAYPSNRSFSVPNVSAKKIVKTRRIDALKQAFEPNVNFSTFFEWYRNTEDIENEKRLTENNDYVEPKLQAVRQAIEAFLDGFTGLRIKRSPEEEMIIRKEDTILSVSQLSHGEKMILGTVGDIARRLAIANPGLDNPLEGEGIVLIDEVDLHLHPDWQKTVVQKLTNTFPNIQFILTTHSTLILNHLHSESIFLLENHQIFPLSAKYPDFNPYGADVEKILDIQGVEEILPEDIRTLFRQYFAAIDANNMEQALKLQAILKTKTDPNHPELLKGKAEIEFQKLIAE